MASFTTAYGHAPAPVAIFGYETVNALLYVIRQENARGLANTRAAVVGRFRSLTAADTAHYSVLGTYSLDHGDTNLAPFVFSRVRGAAGSVHVPTSPRLIRSRRAYVGVLLAIAAIALISLAGCGSTEAIGNRIDGDTLTIYSSVPLHGDSSASGTAVLNGARLALRQIGARIGKYQVALKALDDSTAKTGEWNPGQTSVNARRAVENKTTIGYLGELNSGASAMSIPILNRAGIAQVSSDQHRDRATAGAPAASPGEPHKYYPTGMRTFARVVPNDSIQSLAQVKLQREVGCHEDLCARRR